MLGSLLDITGAAIATVLTKTPGALLEVVVILSVLLLTVIVSVLVLVLINLVSLELVITGVPLMSMYVPSL